jgi:exopolysaccharide production protein ExoQ
MRDHAFADIFERSPARSAALAPLAIIGLLVGIIMPVVSAILYPTYTYTMATPWVEWTRLLELPFVMCEIAIIFWAVQKGMQITETLGALPRDIKYALILLGIGCTASSLFISKRSIDSFTISLFTLVHLLFLMAVSYVARGSKLLDQNLFLKLIGVGLFVLALMTAVKFAFPPPASKVPGGSIIWSNALPGFISIRHFGSWTGAVCAAFTAMLLTDSKERRLSWTHWLYFVSAAMTIWSATRAAILAIAVAAAITIAMNRKMPNFRTLAITAMLTGAALTVAWLLLPDNDPVFLLIDTNDFKGGNELTGGRLDLWAATYHKWLQSPLLGWGSGSTFWEVFVGWTHTQPHNFVLQCLISWGLVGAAGALWLLGRAIIAAHRQAMRYPELRPLLAILDALLVQSMLEGMLHYPRFIMMIMILFAVILSHSQPERSVAHKG